MQIVGFLTTQLTTFGQINLMWCNVNVVLQYAFTGIGFVSKHGLSVVVHIVLKECPGCFA